MEPLKLTSDGLLVTSWMWGKSAGSGALNSALSPLDGSPLGQTRQLDERELSELLAPLGQPLSISPQEVRAFASRLYGELERLAAPIFEALQRETGFVRADCAELRDGILLFARDFCDEGFAPPGEPKPQFYAVESEKRVVRNVAVPWGTIAIVLPASASLFLGVTCLLNALATGNRVILRFPAANPLSAAVLCHALERAQVPAKAASIVMVPAKELLGAIHACSASVLIHYLGSSRHAPSLVSQGFENGKSVVVDGEGNSWVWVASNADVNSVVETLTQGAIRYNGQTCTSINGAVIHPTIYNAVREALIKRWNALRTGPPSNESVDVGPLGDAKQAQWCMERIETSGGQIVCGGSCEGNFLTPTLVENPSEDSELVTQGLFGPALWIGHGTEEEFVRLWARNHFPLCAGVLAPGADGHSWGMRLGNAARIVINGDPSVEWTFEPWGGYPASGNNPVSSWADKYRRIVAIDEKIQKANR
ncbi:4-hydroxybenzaldehyde dehydrogenase (NADP(+)) [Abditibacteriota bacterium]|nr:4-hydroxybenzaldehyde dehydrogenase (NADP(+)) [Abditibacteriota bacterium]